jgi:hypothetical protein
MQTLVLLVEKFELRGTFNLSALAPNGASIGQGNG